MTLLLDTHTFLWFVWADPKLSVRATEIIRDPTSRKLLSLASSWEIAIKVSRGKLDLGASYRGFIHTQMLRNNFELLPITDEHLAGLIDMPFHHKDPFDRMLIAQSGYENRDCRIPHHQRMTLLASKPGSSLLALKGPNISAQGNALGDVPIQKSILSQGLPRPPRGDRDCTAHTGRRRFWRFRQPRALPWAVLFNPFGVEGLSTRCSLEIVHLRQSPKHTDRKR